MSGDNNFMRESALHYCQNGFSIIPIGPDKRPLIEWKQFQENKANEIQIKQWFKKFPQMNIGVVTGKISGIIVLDLDAKHGRSAKQFKIPPTACVKTGGGGEHFFFKHPGGHIPSTNGQLFGDGVDLKADGGYVVLAPSLHLSGKRYEWVVSLEDGIADVPEWLMNKIQSSSTEKLWKKDPSKVSKGSRNETAASVAGKLRSTLPTELQEVAGWSGLREWNNSTQNPLPEKELRSVWNSVKKYKNNQKDPPGSPDSIADKLLKQIVQREDILLFHDEHKEGHIALDVDGHQEIFGCKSKALKRWVSNEIWKLSGKAASQESIKSILGVLEGKGCYEGKEHKLHNRVAWHEGSLWYDLTNRDWQAISINGDEWKVVNNPPVLFKRYPHNKSQVIPIKGGDINLFMKYINITNKEHRLLLLVFLVSCFVPDFAHVILIIFGTQGSAKSTLSRLLRSIIDPSIIEVANLPENQKELVQTLAHHHFLFFDNISHISEITSDTLCRAITGGGFSKRELYSDDDDIIYNFKRCLGINGINLVATRPDLLERSMLIELERIDPEKRKQESELMEEFKNDLPSILGGVFDTLSKAIVIRPSIKVDSLPRMADFAAWGCAISEALGYSQEAFLDAYRSNITKQTETALSENIVGSAIIRFMSNRTVWEGTATELLSQLDNIGDAFENLESKDKYWPRSANTLSRKLNELKVNLREAGVEVSIVSGMIRKIVLRAVKEYIIE